MKKKRNLFDELFSFHNMTTNQILQDIIVDRKYNVPEWVINKIDVSVICSLLLAHGDDNACVTFLHKIVHDKKFKDHKYLAVSLYEHDLLSYAYIIPDKKFYKYIKAMSDITIDTLETIMESHYKFDGCIPVEYIIMMIHLLVGKIPNNKSIYAALDKFYPFIDKYNGDYLDDFFKSLYDYYLMDNDCDNIFNGDSKKRLLIKYWERGGVYIPYDITDDLITLYLFIHNRDFKSQEFDDSIIPIMERIARSSDKNLICSITSKIMQCLMYNLNNIKAIRWSVNSDDVSSIRYMYKLTNLTLKNYADYDRVIKLSMDLPSANISLDEYQYFITIKKGKSIDESLLYITDYGAYIEFILLNLPREILIDKFINNEAIPNGDNKDITILEYICNDETFITSRLMNVFLGIVLSENKVIDVILENNYMTFSEILTLSGQVNIVNTISKYPNVIQYYDAISPIAFFEAYRLNENIINYFNWEKIPKYILAHHILKNGYFPIKTNLEAIQPNYFLNTSKLIEIIKSSTNGIGYCIDFELTEYQSKIIDILLELYTEK